MVQTGRLIKVKHGGDDVYIPTHNIIAMGKSKLKAWVIIQGQKIEFDPVHFSEIFEAWPEPAVTIGGQDNNAKQVTATASPFNDNAKTPGSKDPGGIVKDAHLAPGTITNVSGSGAIPTGSADDKKEPKQT